MQEKPEEAPLGERFSLVYLAKGAALSDSTRLRGRLAAFMYGYSSGLGEVLRYELGIYVPSHSYGVDWNEFYKQAEMRDVLDSITLFCRHQRDKAAFAITTIGRMLREENLRYRLDEKGGVHFLVDQEAEVNRVSTLAGLGAQRYAAARARFEAGHAALDGVEPDAIAAIRGVFDANETVFRLTTENKASRLGSTEVSHLLTPLIAKQYQGADLASAKLLARSYGEWVNAAHHYRHAPGVEDPSPPPLELAVAMMSAGSAYLRWLIEVDQRALSQG